MVVGEAMTGKSSCIKLLSAAISKEKQQTVSISWVNPKSVTLEQLYGDNDPVTHDWIDGILSFIIRNYSDDPSPNLK